MFLVMARNVNEALPLGLSQLAHFGVPVHTRAGAARTLPRPLTTHYLQPTERVLFDATRDANPFFHLMEAIWMFAGRRDVAWIATFLPRFADFSDDGGVFHGAYGWRWRRHFGRDQLELLRKELTVSPGSRRAVLGMWDPTVDLFQESRDIPCNLSVKFATDPHTGALNAIVFNRSNDAVLGAYGANAVHFSFLHELLATALGRRVGWLEQVSGDFHVYDREWAKLNPTQDPYFPSAPLACPYELGEVQPLPLVGPGETYTDFERDTQHFLAVPTARDIAAPDFFRTAWFPTVAWPMRQSYLAYAAGDLSEALATAETVAASDWRRAAREWLQRRLARRQRAGA